MNKVLSERPTSGFLLSMGSSLALETIFSPISQVYDKERVVTRLEDLSTYSLYVFNISTLLRNIINSVKYIDLVTVSKADIYNTLLEEIEFLSTIFGNNGIQVKFYSHNYQYVKDVYGNQDRLRKSFTDKQHYIDTILEYCLSKIAKEDEVTSFHKNISYDKKDSVLLFTHIPFDLLSHTNFLKLDLLESNTGVIKTRKDWWTKYYPIPGKDMSFLPMMEYILSIIGDNHMFAPAPVKERIKLWEAMKKMNVHPLSSEISFKFLFGQT